MRALVQRVKRCSVAIDGTRHSSITTGMLVLLGVREGDSSDDAEHLAERCSNLRIFDDAEGKMNLSAHNVGASAMIVSQFTLYGDTRKGNRPSYTEAAPPDVAQQLYEEFIGHMKKQLGDGHVSTGVFRAMMDVELVNDGPVTILLESKNHHGRKTS